MAGFQWGTALGAAAEGFRKERQDIREQEQEDYQNEQNRQMREWQKGSVKASKGVGQTLPGTGDVVSTHDTPEDADAAITATKAPAPATPTVPTALPAGGDSSAPAASAVAAPVPVQEAPLPPAAPATSTAPQSVALPPQPVAPPPTPVAQPVAQPAAPQPSDATAYTLKPSSLPTNVQHVYSDLAARTIDGKTPQAVIDAVPLIYAKESSFGANGQGNVSRGYSPNFALSKATQADYHVTNPNDMGQELQATVAKATDGYNQLSQKLGRPPTPFELSINHEQSTPATAALLTADPTSSAIATIRPFYKSDADAQQAVLANIPGAKATDNPTVADYLAAKQKSLAPYMSKTAGGAPGQAQAPDLVTAQSQEVVDKLLHPTTAAVGDSDFKAPDQAPAAATPANYSKYQDPQTGKWVVVKNGHAQTADDIDMQRARALSDINPAAGAALMKSVIDRQTQLQALTQSRDSFQTEQNVKRGIAGLQSGDGAAAAAALDQMSGSTAKHGVFQDSKGAWHVMLYDNQGRPVGKGRTFASTDDLSDALTQGAMSPDARALHTVQQRQVLAAENTAQTERLKTTLTAIATPSTVAENQARAKLYGSSGTRIDQMLPGDVQGQAVTNRAQDLQNNQNQIRSDVFKRAYDVQNAPPGTYTPDQIAAANNQAHVFAGLPTDAVMARNPSDPNKYDVTYANGDKYTTAPNGVMLAPEHVSNPAVVNDPFVKDQTIRSAYVPDARGNKQPVFVVAGAVDAQGQPIKFPTIVDAHKAAQHLADLAAARGKTPPGGVRLALPVGGDQRAPAAILQQRAGALGSGIGSRPNTTYGR